MVLRLVLLAFLLCYHPKSLSAANFGWHRLMLPRNENMDLVDEDIGLEVSSGDAVKGPIVRLPRTEKVS